MKSIKAYVALATLVLAGPQMVYADTLFGIYAGAGTWQQQFGGDVRSGISNVDVEDDLAIDDDSNIILYFALEHGFPVLPNIRAQHFNIDVAGDNVLSRTIDFNGQVFTISDAVATNVNLTQSDAVLYYELLDNVVSLDVGLAISLVEGEIEVSNASERAQADFDEVIPMAYARVRADLPLTGLWVGAQAQGMSYSGNSLMEFDAQLGWESELGLGFEMGYRTMQLELEDFDRVASAQIDINGPYASLNYHF
jgi:outer membrane protein